VSWIFAGYDANMTALEWNRITQWSFDYAVKPSAIAACFVVVALLWTFPLQHIIAYPFVFLFFGAIMGSAWFGGFIAGIIAVAMSGLVVTYFFIPPLFSMSVAKDSESFLTAFFVCAIAITIVSSARRRNESAIRQARDQLEAKVHERTVELERSNGEIRESERQLRMLTEAIPQQIWRADASGHIEYCNQHLRLYIGQFADEALGDSFFSILHPEDEPFYRQGLESAFAIGEGFEMETRVRGANGAYRWFLARARPQHNEDGKIARWYGIHIDIEEQRRVQQSLMDAQDNLTRLSRISSMAEMAASIAHELNQPLTAVVTHAYACREWLNTAPANVEKASSTAEKIVQESTRASAVVKRVRALFRKDKEAPVREPTDVNQLISDLARLLREEAIRRGVSIRLDLARDLAKPDVDSVQIQQVLLNLAMNGMEAMAEKQDHRELAISSRNHIQNEILVSVADTGGGVAAEIADRIFDPFFSTKKQGTGMGLALCRSIIEEHDGHLGFLNLPEGGAVFQFTLRSHS
jgi:PAS domain S-box-containing protein